MAGYAIGTVLDACREVSQRRRLVAQVSAEMDEACARVQTVYALLENISGSRPQAASTYPPLADVLDRLYRIVEDVNRAAEELEQERPVRAPSTCERERPAHGSLLMPARSPGRSHQFRSQADLPPRARRRSESSRRAA